MKSLLTTLIILFAFACYASEVQWSSRVEGNSIDGATMEIEDGDYAELSFPTPTFTDVRSFGYVRFGLNDRENMDFEGTPNEKTIVVNFDVTPYDDNYTPQPTIQESLTIEYYNGSAQVLDASDFRMEGVHKFDVNVTSITIDGSTPSGALKNYIYLEAGFYAERYYQLDLISAPDINSKIITYDNQGGATETTASATTASTDEILLHWDYIDGSEYYDLEWTWVDSYSETSLSSANSATSIDLSEKEFEHNSSRIRTTDQHYTIPHVFAKGYLIFRVRGVGKWLDEPEKDLYGTWSSGVNASTVSDWDYITITEEHEGEKNWQYQSTYAENGKKKEVTQYFDGSLRGRQTVTRINSDGHSIVGETIYDNEGREAISILPVPQDNPAIKYYSSINKNSAGTTYSHHDFDWEDASASTCAPDSATPLSDASGAASYYSVNGYDPNSDQEWQQYVPESEGYAFTQKEYTPDNTGRVRRESGVGSTHKIGSGHETEYFYLQPSQEELNRLFGYKVGNKSHYKKNMVIDANGQVSVSYLDPQGNVVATAMAGNNSTDFKALDSESDPTYHDQTNTDLLNKLNANDPDTNQDDNTLYSTGNFGSNKDALKLVTPLGVTEDQIPYTFEYNAFPEVYTESCEGVANVSYPYVYDLTLTLRDDCGEDLFQEDFELVTVGEEEIGGAVNSFLTGPISETVDLSKGSYTVYKKLSVNKEALEIYTADYLSENNACLLPFEDFIPAADDDPCAYSCDDCLDELGSLDDFKLRWAVDSLGEYAAIQDLGGSAQYYQNIYNTLENECEEKCEPTTSCEAYKPMLMNDVSPNGQYASLVTGTPNNVSIFSSGVWKGSDFQGTSPANQYVDEYGNAAMVQAYPIISGSGYQMSANGEPSEMVEPWQLIEADFITYFQPSWAEALIEYHPEYPLYEYATAICNEEDDVQTEPSGTISLSSDNFDFIVREQITDYDLTDPNNNQHAIDFQTARPIYDRDPFFQQTYSVHPANSSDPSLLDLTILKKGLMEEAINEYKNTGMSMLRYAYKTALHGNDLSVGEPAVDWNDVAALPSEKQTLVWEKYKFYYLSYKGQINQLLMDYYGFEAGIFNGCIGSGSFGVDVLNSFVTAPPSIYASIMLHAFNLWTSSNPFDNFPDDLCDSEFDDKEIRIIRYDALYNSGSSDDQILTQTSTDADYGQLQQTGLCPLTVDIERLLNALAEDDLLTTTNTSQADVPEFVPDLYEAFMGINLFNQYNGNPSATFNNVTITGTSNPPSYPTSLELNFNNTLDDAQIILSAPTNASTTLDWDDYESVWEVTSIEGSYPNGGANNETEVLLTVVETATQITAEYTASYTVINAATTEIASCVDLQDPNNDPNCKKEEELEDDLIALIQAQVQNNTFNSTGINIENESYYQGSILNDVLGLSTPVDWNGPNASGGTTFNIENFGRKFTFTLDAGQSFPTGSFMITSLDLIINNSVSFEGEFYINAIDDTGTPVELSGNYELEQNGSSGMELIGIDVSCSCKEDIKKEIASNFESLFNTILPVYDDSEGMQPPSLSNISDILHGGVELEVLGNGGYNFEPANECLEFDMGMDLADSSCLFCKPEHDRCLQLEICDPTLNGNETIEYIYNLELITEGYRFTLLAKLSNGEIYDGEAFYRCKEGFPACQDCDPQAAVQQPISCTDAFDDYETEMESLYNITGSSSPEELEVFRNEILVPDTFFCPSSYSYITEAYIYYLGQFNITSPEQMNYITIGDFGNTYLGYSNDLLMDAVDDYVLDVASDTSDLSTYQDWSTYMSTTYFEANEDICPAMMPDPFIPELDLNIAPCDLWEDNIDQVNASNQHDIYMGQAEEAFIQAYIQGAMESVVETFTENHLDKEYHYTLYYYDKAGNLIQTVPPKGVKRFEFDASGTPIVGENGDKSQTHSAINDLRANFPEQTDLGTSSDRKAPDHTHKTRYRYNSLNQLVYQKTPDGGESKFAYDDLGRLVASQNAMQDDNDQYSYTVYDGLGRVVEVGEMTTSEVLLTITAEGKLVYATLPHTDFDVNTLDWVNNASTSEIIAREEVTRTIYDELAGIKAPFVENPITGSLSQILVRSLFGVDYAHDNTRNRIVGTVYQEDYDPNINIYESGIFYDYDVHGNVKHLIQIYNKSELQALNQHIKHIEYEYDLVSGNVNKVIYQNGKEDQFIHRYSYDGDNRITIAETSKDDFVYEKDAKYFYYEHGPLARTELGEDKVQANDFAYTLQGWIKSVNGEEIDETTMMGQDGKTAQINALGARDVYGYSLSYFDDDYDAANTAMLNYTPTSTTTGQSLFNGNIRSMATALSDVSENKLKTHQTNYQYDQLNRIKSMVGYYQELGNMDQLSEYSSSYSFDENGNLDSLRRYALKIHADGSRTSELMDDFEYHYNETINNGFNNQLSGLTDHAGSSQFSDIDIDNSITSTNYEYDPIGQLIKDTDEGIDTIKWKVNNKVEEIVYASGKVIHFDYDPMGNRIAKHMIGNNDTTSTFYILDAQGNQMSMYERNTDNSIDVLLSERNIYGSERVGQEQLSQVMAYDSEIGYGNVGFDALTIDNTNAGLCSTGGVLSIIEPATPVYVFDYSISDYDGDGNADLTVTNNATPSTDPDLLNASGKTTSFSAQMTINTEPGEHYSIYFEVLDISTEITGFGVFDCSNSATNANIVVLATGGYSVDFTATSAKTRLKWFNGSPDSGYSQIVLSNLNIQGPGDILGTGIPNSGPLNYVAENEKGDKRYELT
ncbi:MAG: hypothetical protein WED10_15490, partial [Brumimicrobium sp.]